jgi:hypothetical protein
VWIKASSTSMRDSAFAAVILGRAFADDPTLLDVQPA